MPQRRSPASRSATKTSVPAVRRPRGEPRRLLLDAARELFARKDYRSTTTREIAESAGVTEYLLFRHFGSKAGLFREALVLPFTSIVDEFAQQWQTLIPEETDEDELARHFVEQVYDVVVEHRGLLLTLVASEAFSEEEVADAGIADIRRALGVLGSDQRRGHAVTRHAIEPAGPACALDDGDDRRHGGIAFVLLRSEAALTGRDCRRTRPSDTARLPASRRLKIVYGLAKPAALKTFWPASPVTRSTNFRASSGVLGLLEDRDRVGVDGLRRTRGTAPR